MKEFYFDHWNAVSLGVGLMAVEEVSYCVVYSHLLAERLMAVAYWFVVELVLNEDLKFVVAVLFVPDIAEYVQIENSTDVDVLAAFGLTEHLLVGYENGMTVCK
jgi:hypothetical protein